MLNATEMGHICDLVQNTVVNGSACQVCWAKRVTTEQISGAKVLECISSNICMLTLKVLVTTIDALGHF